MTHDAEKTLRKPSWIRIKPEANENYAFIKGLRNRKGLHTVCEEARCPNVHECWGKHKTATFMILGEVCTRRCRFCSVKTGLPTDLDRDEPVRVAEAVQSMQLRHAVITMVNRDDLDNGGADIMAETVRKIHELNPGCSVEVLASDMMGKRENIAVMAESNPQILSHNLETVRRLTPRIRSRSDYDRSLMFSHYVKKLDPGMTTKSSIMLGLGETKKEVVEAMDDLREHDVDMINLGQYLQPTRTNIDVQRYWTPAEFDELKEIACAKGFKHCESGPFVRSSYHAAEQVGSMSSSVQLERRP
ncbi:MAG: lipoyl synthase [Chitinivibrionales bacterium]|nr:lipoyl synthase [Chitinivibrionales bacterium]